jgi:hypothetical protein
MSVTANNKMPLYIAVQLENTDTKTRVWLTLPVTRDKFEDALERIGATCGNFAIIDYVRRAPGVFNEMLMRTPLAVVNHLAERLNALTYDEIVKLCAISHSDRYFFGVAEVIEYTYATDDYALLPGVTDEEKLGVYHLGNINHAVAPERLKQYIDRRDFGKRVSEDEQGAFSPLGYVTAKNGWQIETATPRPVPDHLNLKGYIGEDIYGNWEDKDYDYGV